MYKTILVPLDGSKRAGAILPHVEQLARKYGAKVIFLRVEEDSLMLGYNAVIDISKYQEEHDRRTEEVLSYLACVGGEFRKKKIHPNKVVAYGSVVQSILTSAEREGTVF